VVVQIVDNNQYPVFDTCTQRLGAGAITRICIDMLQTCRMIRGFQRPLFLLPGFRRRALLSR
jgi:hypothetical protein